MKKVVNCFALVSILAVVSATGRQALAAARKTIYIKPFALVQGLPAADPAGALVKDYISEEIIATGSYSITSDDEVNQVIEQEALKMSLDACYDDACIRKLMESIKTDYIIYGNISLIDEKYFVTAKILDRTSGRVVLARVKTIKFKKRDYMERGSKALGEFLITGSESSLKDFQDYLDERDTEKDEPSRLVGWKSNVVGRAPLMRIGYGFSSPGDELINDIYNDRKFSLLLDMFLWRERDSRGDGFDFYLRVIARAYNWSLDKFDKMKELTPDIPPTATPPASPNDEIGFFGFGGGARYIRGFYRYGVLWQAYVSLAYQYLLVLSGTTIMYTGSLGWEERAKNDISNSPFGLVGGLGIEIGFTPYFGLFGEVDYGYNPVEMWGKKRNLEGLSLLFGASFRTSYSY
jgi:hypothetical protein